MARKAKTQAKDCFTVYHEALTSAAEWIVRNGFVENGTGYDTPSQTLTGVLFSPRPPRYEGPHARAWAVVEVELALSERDLERFLYPREDGHRIWLIPSSVVNSLRHRWQAGQRPRQLRTGCNLFTLLFRISEQTRAGR